MTPSRFQNTMIAISLCLMLVFAMKLYAKKPIPALSVITNTTPSLAKIKGDKPIVKYTNEKELPLDIDPDVSSIRLSLLLDTSGSMDGLIEQAKSQLWRIVKELSSSKHDGETPNIILSLYEYGKTTAGAKNLEIRRIAPFTTDMDYISQELFSLTTNGGNEYCGQVIYNSVSELAWGDAPNDLRLIYIAGNEPFTQGPMDFKKACGDAVSKDIVVNTIYCGDLNQGINSSWKKGADLTGGEYMNIDHNQQTVYVASPYDDQLEVLNRKLNDTYISYSADGYDKKMNQTRQDGNAKSYSKANAADRISFKSSKIYKNTEWDLVDGYEAKKEKVFEDKKHLSEEYQNKSDEELEQIIKVKKAEREQIKMEIGKLSKDRDAYVIEEKKKLKSDGGLDESIIKSAKKAAVKKGYKF